MRIVSRRVGIVATAGALAIASGLGAAPGNAAPAGHGSWHFTKPYRVPHLRDAVNGLSCPTAKVCVAASSNIIFWTTNATGNKKTWKHAAIEPLSQPTVATGDVILDDVSCASVHLCVAVDDIGNALVSTDPTGGKKTWHTVRIAQIELEAVGCSSKGSCAAVDYNGNVFSTTNPSGAWSVGDVTVQNASGSDAGASCAGNGLCAIVSGSGKIATTTDPGGTKWHLTNVKGGRWQGISCPTTNRCVAGGTNKESVGLAAVSNGAGSWKSTKLGPDFSPKVSCASASDCFVTSNYASTHVSAHKHAWKRVSVPTTSSETAVSCPDPQHCFIGTATNDFLAGKR